MQIIDFQSLLRQSRQSGCGYVRKSTGKPLSVFGLKNDYFSVGAEWNDLFNANFVNAKHQYGSSLYFRVKLPKNFELFGRWDYLFSNNDWNLAKDGQIAFLGFQYSPIKYVKIAPNCQVKIPKSGKIEGLVRVNLEIAL
jgi:hypothetical protein